MRAPGEETEQFQLVLPFVPEGRQNMVAWLAASSDPSAYGRLLSLDLPASENVPGPSIVFSRINQDQQFSQERTLLGQGGSAVIFGDLLVIPIESSFLYVQPVYVKADQSAAPPELKRVVVVNGDTVAVGDTLDEALEGAVEGQVTEPGGGDGPDDGGVDRTVAELLAEAAAPLRGSRRSARRRRPGDVPGRDRGGGGAGPRGGRPVGRGRTGRRRRPHRPRPPLLRRARVSPAGGS